MLKPSKVELVEDRDPMVGYKSSTPPTAADPLRVGADFVVLSTVVRDLEIFIDSDVSMRSHVTQSVLTCSSVLRPLRTIRRSVSRSVIQSLVISPVLSRLDYGNVTLAGIPQHLLRRLQSVMNAAACLVYSSSRCGHITLLLRQLHWLKAKDRIDFKLAVLVYKCMHGTAPPYLANDLSRSADLQASCRLRSASSSSLVVRRTRLSAIGHLRLPPHAYGTVCLSMSQLLLLSQYFVVALRLTCSLFLFLNLY